MTISHVVDGLHAPHVVGKLEQAHFVFDKGIFTTKNPT